MCQSIHADVIRSSRACNADPAFLNSFREVPLDRMVNLTQVALSISPLVLLMSQWGVSESFNRECLVEVSFQVFFTPLDWLEKLHV
jgi:hypothetical protein